MGIQEYRASIGHQVYNQKVIDILITGEGALRGDTTISVRVTLTQDHKNQKSILHQ
jgi:hypothetical protein